MGNYTKCQACGKTVFTDTATGYTEEVITSEECNNNDIFCPCDVMESIPFWDVNITESLSPFIKLDFNYERN